jgi:putative heme-binding domain-containing protein
VEKQYGKFTAATPGEKQARISWLNVVLGREKAGDVARGQALFVKHCAACHQLHGEGGKIGPDLTTADRKNRGYMLAQIVDPNGYIRPEYVVHNVVTLDGRKLSGIVAASSNESVTLVNVIDNKPVQTVVAKVDIESMLPSAVSLMPEKMLDTLSDPEIADLFAFLTSDSKTPGTNVPGSPVVTTRTGDTKKKLKVAMISGSFEYKSDESLAAFKKFLEANYEIECTLISAKSDKDKDLAGLEALDSCDVAIFFTRRLQLEGDSLEKVKKFAASNKPLVGIRTASHGFQNWLQMDKDVLGGDYQGHFGQGIECDIALAAKNKEHPVLKGLTAFKTSGGLYKNPNVASDVSVLLSGTIPNQPVQPVAWVREKDGRRLFYTSLGTPDDFKDENFRRLVVNALAWTTKTELKATK